MAADASRVEEAIQKYLALSIFQIVICIGLIVCPSISLATTSDDDLRTNNIYAVAAMVFIQATMGGLVYYFGRKSISDGSPCRKCGFLISVGMFIALPEFATIIVSFVFTGIYLADDPDDETNKNLAITILIFCVLALLANILTVIMGCTLGNALGANFNNQEHRGHRVEAEDQHIVIIDRTANGTSRATADRTAQIQELQIQNSLLQQQILLQQQQQLNDQQRRNNYGFQPSASSSGGGDPVYPPPYSDSSGPPPAYSKY